MFLLVSYRPSLWDLNSGGSEKEGLCSIFHVNRQYISNSPLIDKSTANRQPGENGMDILKILEKPQEIGWYYDEEADVLYISVGKPQPAVGIDIGEGIVVRYDEMNKQVVGLTLIGLRDRVLKGISERAADARRSPVKHEL
jgi:uncharacterized protein YuzE